MDFKNNITILHDGFNPTSFYWLSNVSSNFINFKDQIPNKLLNNSDTIIIVRYIPLKLLFHLYKLHKKNKNIILFIDDDLLSLNIFSDLPINYKLKLFFRIYCYKNFLQFFIKQIWVTNINLKQKIIKQLKNNVPTKVLKLNFQDGFKQKSLYRITFIGTSSHVLELKWIKKLFTKIQSQREDCLIELFIDKNWRSYFKSIPRIKMIYPMDWESFLLDTKYRNVDIVLNPILRSKFNSFRSPTKFFDTTRLGAVGIYSKTEPFEDFINDDYDGILLKNDLNLWYENIIYLLDDKDKRDFLYSNALKRMKCQIK